MRDNLIRFRQRNFSGKKDSYNFSRRAYLRNLNRITEENIIQMNIHSSNLITALNTAIVEHREYELKNGYIGESALVAGWKELLNHLKDGGQIHVIHSVE